MLLAAWDFGHHAASCLLLGRLCCHCTVPQRPTPLLLCYVMSISWAEAKFLHVALNSFPPESIGE